ncbi:PREDICTED: coiled-coil domain-containing protein 186-like isoform X2 [Papilio xuthus]|uniref:Coiled-coil domain-containing protein 186-like isoform X2 n=1 Tax=Papilio xuthus TaxID=66420 RepID=A0AAJ6ZKK1_PAPXU|nr:PREDICTED: coiled-coil domain-containing protein 186-like isoform X2 [Papilio xuthus]
MTAMSKENDQNSVHIDSVYVDGLEKECVTKSDQNSDSGVDTGELSSATANASSDSEVSPLKVSDKPVSEDEISKNEDSIENESSFTPASISPIEPIENMNSDDSLINETTDNVLTRNKNDFARDDEKSSINSDIDTLHIPENEQLEVSMYMQSDLDNVNRNFTTSTVSLNEPIKNQENSIICKSPYSKSAENITNLDEPQTNSLNSSTNTINTDEILSEFTNQKSKISATQKIIPDNHQDGKHSRLPKEILSQDLGSIVKNVHGIFWSVSGNIKNAYTQRVSSQKVPVKNLKPILNGKVMNDIFENTIDNQIPNSDKIITEEIKSNPEPNDVNGECDDMKKDVLKLQIESLERMLSEQRKENVVLRERVKQHVDELNTKDQTFKELEAKLDVMGKKVEQAQRDADAAVMRYAGAECAAIEGRRAAEAAKRAQQAAVTECELLAGKLKSAHSEKQRICQLYDDKCHELQNSERETAKLREDVKELEGRLKWTQSKLRMEMDAYKESSERAEKLSQQVTELEAAKEAAAAGATDSARAKVLESELKESQAALILCRHERDELERKLTSVVQQLDTCKRERDDATASLSVATDEVDRLREHNARLEQEAAELAALRAQAALADTLSSQLQRETERASQAEEALSRERARAETCARREAAALEHAARLTAQHVAQRARTSEHEAKAQALSADNVSLRERAEALEAEAEKLRSALAEEEERRQRENRVLARKVAELTEEVAEVSKRLEWEKGENSVLKKKNSSAIKELNRELQRALKRSEQLEARLQNDAASNRTGSVTSLSSGEGAQSEERAQNGLPESLPDVQTREPERQALIERIVSLQRAAARRAERCEFLEEHARQLTAELRGKARLLRHLLAAQPAGAVANSASDTNKKEIAMLGGGAMAALWGGDPAGLTPQLSLEMNRRLQALLEDTLLKNITLKENIDTLGEEIARLKAEKQTDH